MRLGSLRAHPRLTRTGFVACAFVATSLSHALTFNFSPASGMSQQAIDGFAAAGALWSNVLFDPITVNMNINFTALGSGILGQTGSTSTAYTYTSVRSAMVLDALSADDQTALSSLPNTSSYGFQINKTTTNSAIHDATTSQVRLSNANAKALGVYAGSATASDASISFSTSFTWDFDRSNGISSNAYDFVGIAAHEIGHALGFTSGVDILDTNTVSDATLASYHSALDLFRFQGSNRSFVVDNTAKYFSIDGGATQIAQFSNGAVNGDGRQASHWKDNLGLGIMDPTAANGEFLTIGANDLRAFDVIGYSRSAVPEPASLAALGLGALALLRRRRQR